MVWKRVLSIFLTIVLSAGCVLLPPTASVQAASEETAHQLYHQTVPDTREELLKVWPSNASNATVNNDGGRPHSQIVIDGQVITLQAYINDGKNGELEIRVPDLNLDTTDYGEMELLFRYARFTDYEYDEDINIEWANSFKVYASTDGGTTWTTSYAKLKEQRIVGRGYDDGDMAVIYEAVSTDLTKLAEGKVITNLKIKPYGPAVRTDGFAHILSITVNGYETKAPGLTKPATKYISVEEETLRQIVVQHMYDTLDVEWVSNTEITSKNGSYDLYYAPGYLYKSPVYCRWIDTSMEMLVSAINSNGVYTGGKTDKTVYGMDCIGIVYDALSRVTNGPGFGWCYVFSDLCAQLKGGLANDPFTRDTKEIIDRYGTQRIYEAYATLEPGDFILRNPSGGHARLVTGKTKVVYSNNGTINGASTVTYSDTAGSNLYYWQKPNGGIVTSTQKDVAAYQDAHPTYTYLYGSSCRKDVVISFEELLKTTYLPYTLKEYQQSRVQAPRISIYDAPNAETVMETGLDILLESNYYINNIRATVTDLSTGDILFSNRVYQQNDIYVAEYSNSALDACLASLPAGAYRLAVDVCSGPVTEVGGEIPVTRALELDISVGGAALPEEPQEQEIEINISGKSDCSCTLSDGLVLNVTAPEPISEITVKLMEGVYGDLLAEQTLYPGTTSVSYENNEFGVDGLLAVRSTCELKVTVTTASESVTKTVRTQRSKPLPAAGGALASGRYYVSGATMATAAYTVASGQTVDICLHGKRLYKAQQIENLFIINGELIVRDESKNGTGRISGNGYTGGCCFYVDGSSGSQASVTILGGTITSFNNNATEGGAAAYVTGANAAFSLKSGTITLCSADNGGALFAGEGGTIAVSGGKITENTATENGGGICIGDDAVLILEGGSITKNTATNGGGLFAAGALEMTGGTVTWNSAANGGGVYAAENADAAMSGTVVSDNTATANGGGVYTAGVFSMSGGDISGNMGALSGGGVCAAAGSAFVMSGGNITDNEAHGTDTDHGNGGGVYVANTTAVQLLGGTVSDNIAELCGGGVYVYKGRFTQNGGVISGNRAQRGGGIALGDSTSKFYMRGGIIGGESLQQANFLVGKDSEVYGNAVYVNDGKAYLYGGDITGNVSDNSISILKDGKTVKTANGNGAAWVRTGTVELGPDPASPGTYTGTQIYGNKGRWAGGIWINGAGTLNMTGGTIGMNGDTSVLNNASGDSSGSAFYLYAAGGKANISGGKINGGYTAEGTLTVSGGKFSEDPTEYLVAGHWEESITEGALKFRVTKPDITGTVVNLGNALGIKFYVSINEDKVDLSDYTVKYSRAYNYEQGDENAKADVVDQEITLTASDYPAAGNYMFYYTGISAKEMCDQVTLTICSGDVVMDTLAESLQSYAQRTLNYSGSKESAKKAVVDMLVYGAEAQNYFGYNEDNLATKNLTNEQRALATQEDPACEKLTPAQGYAGTIISLQDNIVLKMYIDKAKAGENSVAAITYTNHAGSNVSGTAQVKAYGNNYVEVVVDTLAVADARTVVTCTIGEYSCSYSIEACVAAALASEEAEISAAEAVTVAMMKFADSAYAVLHPAAES